MEVVAILEDGIMPLISEEYHMPRSGSIIDEFYIHAEECPDKTAIICGDRHKTYKEFANLVSSYSNCFLEQGVHYGDHIGFPMNISIESVAIMLAIADIGAVMVPVNPTLPEEAVNNFFEAGNVVHLVAFKQFFSRTQEWKIFENIHQIFCVDGKVERTVSLKKNESGHIARPKVEKDGEELFILTLTSGSTGKPKAIALTQQDKLNRAMKHIELYSISKDDKILAATPLYHSLAERLVLIPMLIGATSVLLERFTPVRWVNCIKENSVTFTIAVSSQLSQVAQMFSDTFVPEIDTLRCVVSSSALLEAHVREYLAGKLSCDLHEMYGTSEVSTVTDINVKNAAEKKRSVGKPVPGAQIRIIDESGKECATGDVGQICCRTPLLCHGYYRQEQLFQRAMLEGYFSTGDLGRLDEDGFLYYCGRKKEIIITGGINVYPVDIETCIRRNSDVEECAAFSYPDEKLGEVVAVAMTEKQGRKIDVRKIQVLCAGNLADYQQPRRIYVIKEMPKNTMGKLVRGRLLEIVSEMEENYGKSER